MKRIPQLDNFFLHSRTQRTVQVRPNIFPYSYQYSPQLYVQVKMQASDVLWSAVPSYRYFHQSAPLSTRLEAHRYLESCKFSLSPLFLLTVKIIINISNYIFCCMVLLIRLLFGCNIEIIVVTFFS